MSLFLFVITVQSPRGHGPCSMSSLVVVGRLRLSPVPRSNADLVRTLSFITRICKRQDSRLFLTAKKTSENEA